VPSETESTEGHCPTHGDVEATREIPKMRFPYVYYAVVRALAKRKPYKCPACGAAVDVD